MKHARSSLISRRAFAARALAAPLMAAARPASPVYTFRQYHNQPASTILHHSLVEMWTEIQKQSGGRVEAQIFPENNGITGGDLQALQMVRDGEIQFFTLNGAPIANVVPSFAVQQLPFAFPNRDTAIRVFDGALGEQLQRDAVTAGIHTFRIGAFENGLRQICTISKPLHKADDLKGLRMRTPQAEIFMDFYRALGATPVPLPFVDLPGALKNGTVDGEDNPTEMEYASGLFEQLQFVCMTDHAWAPYNLLANLETWNSLPGDLQSIIERNVSTAIWRQRRKQLQKNKELDQMLLVRGIVFTRPDLPSFRERMLPVYRLWKGRVGSSVWKILETEVKIPS